MSTKPAEPLPSYIPNTLIEIISFEGETGSLEFRGYDRFSRNRRRYTRAIEHVRAHAPILFGRSGSGPQPL